jgi:hypothetical protein
MPYPPASGRRLEFNSMCCFSWRLSTRALVLAAVLSSHGFSQAASPSAAVDLFTAVAEKTISVRVIPRDSTTITLVVQNETEQPVSIRMPAGMAAAPVLAQQPGFLNNNFIGGNNNNNNNVNQAVGMNGQNNNNNNNNNAFPGLFNIPAERTLKIKLPCVCLEHGKPEPNTRVKYELVPLSTYSADPRLPQALAAIGKELDQRSAQLVAWHLVNGKSWTDLAALKIKHLDGFSTPQFTKHELNQARTWLEKLPTEKETRQLSYRN